MTLLMFLLLSVVVADSGDARVIFSPLIPIQAQAAVADTLNIDGTFSTNTLTVHGGVSADQVVQRNVDDVVRQLSNGDSLVITDGTEVAKRIAKFIASAGLLFSEERLQVLQTVKDFRADGSFFFLRSVAIGEGSNATIMFSLTKDVDSRVPALACGTQRVWQASIEVVPKGNGDWDAKEHEGYVVLFTPCPPE